MNDKKDRQRLIMVSLDATGRRDMEFMKTLPNFKRFIDEGAFCDNVSSVYPSLTYPAHSAIVSGKMPNHHRIVNNTKFQPSRHNPDWLYKEKYINGKTIVDIAKEKGMTVATFLWPVMGGAKVDFNIPEVLVTRKFQTQVTACLANGTPGFLLDVNKRFGHIRHGVSQPDLDDFLMECVKYTIEKHDPDMIMIHLTDVDTNRHNHGVYHEEVTNALKRHDKRLGELEEYLAKTRPMDKTTFIVLGDHCQIDTHTIVYPNKIFLDKGFLTVKNGKINSYKAIAKDADGSCYIYLNPDFACNEAFLQELTDTLNDMKNNEKLGIEDIFTCEEAKEMGADEECFCMLEGKDGFYFQNEFEVVTEPVNDSKNLRMFATHGYLPTKEGNKTFFAAKGYKIKKGVYKDHMNLWDEGPTIAKILGGHLPGVDGTAVSEFLE